MGEINKLENYIFLSICEKSLDLFKDSYFNTYIGFCGTLKAAMETEDLGRGDLYVIYEIDDYLRKIYDLSVEESNQYIADFFLLEKYLVFEKPVRLISEYFNNSFN